jgi:hypothetical protein
MSEVLLASARDAASSLALVLGAQSLATVLVLLGATTLAAMALSVVARASTAAALGVAPTAAHRARHDVDVPPLVAQSDPDAPGRARPRAPGVLAG